MRQSSLNTIVERSSSTTVLAYVDIIQFTVFALLILVMTVASDLPSMAVNTAAGDSDQADTPPVYLRFDLGPEGLLPTDPSMIDQLATLTATDRVVLMFPDAPYSQILTARRDIAALTQATLFEPEEIQ